MKHKKNKSLNSLINNEIFSLLLITLNISVVVSELGCTRPTKTTGTVVPLGHDVTLQ